MDDLPEEIRRAFPSPVATRGTVQPLGEIERAYIVAALEHKGGNRARTAEQLRIGSATLYRTLESYGLLGARRPPEASGGER